MDELSTYLSDVSKNGKTVILSSGDMWQGSAESNLTKGAIITDWMNEMNFAAMTLGNHEFDWGADHIATNAELAEFSILAINLYDTATGKRASFCEPSVIIERNGVKIGIIGAIGDCKSSISSSLVQNFDFKVGNDLTELVKAESERLRALGCELIIYSLHDGNNYSSLEPQYPSATEMGDYYDISLSDGYVDIVFEGHSHASYVHVDEYGVYHLQNGGYDNGISHVVLKINIATDMITVDIAEIVENDEYAHCEDHPIVDELFEKYDEIIAIAFEELGFNSELRDAAYIRQLVANVYNIYGLNKWGDEYDIVLGGGYISARDPGMFPVGTLQYYDLMSVLPFDNEIWLCSIKGSDLKSRFINNTNPNYFVGYSEYGVSILDQIDDEATYYIISDQYSVDYADNHLTPIESYGQGIYARDLVADYIKQGNLGTEPQQMTISEAITTGEGMAHGAVSSELFYIEGEIVEIANTTYGNLYLEDAEGNRIYVYGVYDRYGNRYDSMTNAPKVGDKIRVLCYVGNYNGAQLKQAYVVLMLEP